MLQQAYAASISQLPWMGEETRKRALEKLAKFNPMVGYPVKWHDYSDIAVDATDLVATLDGISAHDFEDNLSKIEDGPDPEEWHMSPQTVNAYYSPLENAIVFPSSHLAAAVLRTRSYPGPKLWRHRCGHRPRNWSRL